MFHAQCLKAETFFKSLARIQNSQQKHNNLLCFIAGQHRTYALQAGGRSKPDDFVETIFAAQLDDEFPKAAQGAQSKLVWYSNANAPHGPDQWSFAVTIREQQLRFGRHEYVVPKWFHSFAFFETLAAEAGVPLDQLQVQVIKWRWEKEGVSAYELFGEYEEMALPTDDAQEPSRHNAQPPGKNMDRTAAFFFAAWACV